MIERATLEMLQARSALGDRDALNRALILLEGTLLAEARAYFRQGVDSDDLAQRCRIAAARALRSWQPGCGTALMSFVKICARREMIDLLRKEARKRDQADDCIDDWEHEQLGAEPSIGPGHCECLHVIPEPFIRAWVERSLIFRDARRHKEALALLKAIAPMLQLPAAAGVVDRVSAEIDAGQWGLFDDQGLDGDVLNESISAVVAVVIAALSSISTGDEIYAFDGNARVRALSVRLARSCAIEFFTPRTRQRATAS